MVATLISAKVRSRHCRQLVDRLQQRRRRAALMTTGERTMMQFVDDGETAARTAALRGDARTARERLVPLLGRTNPPTTGAVLYRAGSALQARDSTYCFATIPSTGSRSRAGLSSSRPPREAQLPSCRPRTC